GTVLLLLRTRAELEMADSCDQTDSTRAKDLELHIQRRVQSELSRLESETSKRFSELKESISVPDSTSDSSEPGAAPPDQPSAKGDPETKASAKSKDLSSQSVEKEIDSLKEKLKRRRVKDDVVKDKGVEKAKEELVECLKLKDRRPLDCWKEVDSFKEEVGRLERGFLGKSLGLESTLELIEKIHARSPTVPALAPGNELPVFVTNVDNIRLSSKITSYFRPAAKVPKRRDLAPSQDLTTQEQPEQQQQQQQQEQEQQHAQQSHKPHLLPVPALLCTYKGNVPPNFSIHPITPTTLPSFRRIITLLLPIRYPDSFYAESTANTNSSSLARVALWQPQPQLQYQALEPHLETPNTTPSFPSVLATNPEPKPSTVVAGIQCRIELLPASRYSSAPEHQCYIQTLALLSPYRSKGIATALLQSIITVLLTHPKYTTVKSMYAHVWEANKEALEWYRKRGFTVEEGVVEGYYRKLTPNTARVVRRRIGVEDHLALQDGGTARKG
ncbi:MAG: hypothetical protein Q9214_003921, partial [Letrouitia sp. 1 TL-2023]